MVLPPATRRLPSDEKASLMAGQEAPGIETMAGSSDKRQTLTPSSLAETASQDPSGEKASAVMEPRNSCDRYWWYGLTVQSWTRPVASPTARVAPSRENAAAFTAFMP